jgi:eIF3 subunit M, C-terminal helix
VGSGGHLPEPSPSRSFHGPVQLGCHCHVRTYNSSSTSLNSTLLANFLLCSFLSPLLLSKIIYQYSFYLNYTTHFIFTPPHFTPIIKSKILSPSLLPHSRCVHRSFGPEQWKGLQQRLNALRASVAVVLDSAKKYNN